MFEFVNDPDPNECRYTGAYVCPKHGNPTPVSRPKAGCSGGRCDCGRDREYVEILRDVADYLPESRSALDGTLKLLGHEVVEIINEKN